MKAFTCETSEKLSHLLREVEEVGGVVRAIPRDVFSIAHF